MVLNVCIFTLNKLFYSIEADQIILPGLTGKLSILKNHIPLITLLDIGLLRIRLKDDWTFFVISAGIAQITRDQAIIFSKDMKEYNFIKKNEIETELQKIKSYFTNKKRNILNYKKLSEFKKIKSEIEALQHILYTNIKS
jgi:F-type H+-transporting ATPase subunit epsilon